MSYQDLVSKAGKRRQPIEPDIPEYIRHMTFSPAESRFVAVMDMETANRGMIASEFHTRCIQQGEIHELICMHEDKKKLVDLQAAWYLGFIEFLNSCVLAKGMEVEVNGEVVGKLVAFDMTHTPNHLNILLATPNPQTGKQKGIQVGEKCHFTVALSSSS